MPGQKLKFSEWLIRKYKLKVRDMKHCKYPRILRRFDLHAITLGEHEIYVKDWENESESERCSLLVHEITHAQQRSRHENLWFNIRYIASQSFRRKIEVPAFLRQMAYLYETSDKFFSTNYINWVVNVLDKKYLLGRRQTRRARTSIFAGWSDIQSGEDNYVKRYQIDAWKKDTM